MRDKIIELLKTKKYAEALEKVVEFKEDLCVRGKGGGFTWHTLASLETNLPLRNEGVIEALRQDLEGAKDVK